LGGKSDKMKQSLILSLGFCENNLVLKKLHFMMNNLYLTYKNTDSRRFIGALVMEMLVHTPFIKASVQQ